MASNVIQWSPEERMCFQMKYSCCCLKVIWGKYGEGFSIELHLSPSSLGRYFYVQDGHLNIYRPLLLKLKDECFILCAFPWLQSEKINVLFSSSIIVLFLCMTVVDSDIPIRLLFRAVVYRNCYVPLFVEYKAPLVPQSVPYQNNNSGL
jgi:hypothetical protein